MKSLLFASVGSAGLVAVLVAAPAMGRPGGSTAERECDDPPILSDVSGTLHRSDGRWTVGGAEVDFGPAWHLSRTTSEHDYDGDGTVETLTREFAGLLGTAVTLEVDPAGAGGDRDVYRVGGTPYREPDGCPPPWAGGPLGGPRDAAPRQTGRDETGPEADAHDEPMSREGRARRDAALRFVDEMRSWTGCVRDAARAQKGRADTFEPHRACGDRPRRQQR